MPATTATPPVSTRYNRPSFLSDFLNLLMLAIPMWWSYTFSFEVFSLGIVGNRLDENNEKHTAAIASSQTTMNTVLFIALSPLFAMSMYASKKVGDLRKLQAQREAAATIE